MIPSDSILERFTVSISHKRVVTMQCNDCNRYLSYMPDPRKLAPKILLLHMVQAARRHACPPSKPV